MSMEHVPGAQSSHTRGPRDRRSHIHVHACTHTHARHEHICTHRHVHAHTSTHTHTQSHAMHARTHVCTHMMHTRSRGRPGVCAHLPGTLRRCVERRGSGVGSRRGAGRRGLGPRALTCPLLPPATRCCEQTASLPDQPRCRLRNATSHAAPRGPPAPPFREWHTRPPFTLRRPPLPPRTEARDPGPGKRRGRRHAAGLGRAWKEGGAWPGAAL